MVRALARAFIALTLLAAAVAVVPGALASLDVSPSNIDLGKIEPGHVVTRHVNVTNTGSAEIEVQTDVQCGCADYVTVEPALFSLGPTERKQVQVIVEVADDADPGIHDYTIRFVELADTGSGGTAQGAFGMGLKFEVRTAGLYITYLDANKHPVYDLDDDGTLGFRFVNAFESELDVTVTGTVKWGEDEREIGPVTFVAPAGGEASAVANERIQTGLTADSDPAVYNVTLSADWTDAATGRSGPTVRSVNIAIGAKATVRDFQATLDGDDVVFRGTLVNEGGTAIEVQMVVEVTETGRPDVARFTSEAIELGPGEEVEATTRWEDAAGAVYRATAYASFKVAGDTGGSAISGERTAEETIVVAGDEAGGTEEGKGASATTTILIAAFVGLLVGGAVAFIAVRKKR